MTTVLIKDAAHATNTVKNPLDSFRDPHALKFKSVEPRSRGLGIELEFPLIRQDGTAISIEQLRAIFKGIAEITGEKVDESGFGVSKHFRPEASVCTIEIPLPKASNLDEANAAITEFASPMMVAAKLNGAIPLGFGTQPVTQPSKSLCLPLSRYEVMLETWGKAYSIDPNGISYGVTVNAAQHVHVQAHSGNEAVRIYNTLNGFAPEFLAISANSRPIKGPGAAMADSRSVFYEDYILDKNLAGVGPRFGSFQEYFEGLANLPLYLLKRNEEYLVVNEVTTLRNFMVNGIVSTTTVNAPHKVIPVIFEEGDIEVREGMVRWDARIKGATGTVELRLNSMQRSKSDVMTIAAVTLGLASNLEKAEEVAYRREIGEIRAIKRQVADRGISGNEYIIQSAREMLDLAKEGLEKIGEDTRYLDPAYKRLERAEVPSDISRGVLRDRGFKPFIESLRFDLE